MSYPVIEGPLALRLLGSAVLLLVYLGVRYLFRKWDQQEAKQRYEDYLRRGCGR